MSVYHNIGDRLLHRPTSHTFTVTKRTKDHDGNVSYWDGESKYPHNDCEIAPAKKARPKTKAKAPKVVEPAPAGYTGKFFKYTGSSEVLKKQYGDLALEVLTDNGAMGNCRAWNGTEYKYFGNVPLYNCSQVAAPVRRSDLLAS